MSGWILPVIGGIAVGFTIILVRMGSLYWEHRRLLRAIEVDHERAIDVDRANLLFASSLLATLEARDRYTAGHSAAVAFYAQDIARHMGLPVEQQELVYVCGLVHDIGKIGLPAGLLEKPGTLTPDERREMERHSEIGERILANVDTYAEIGSVVRHHHERWDGQGYPDGLAGEAIPLLSRVIAVANAYSTMTAPPPYVKAIRSTAARAQLAQRAGSEFDPSVVAALEGHDFPPLTG